MREDRERGRNYLPREDRERFPDLTSVLRFEGERAKRYFEESKPLIELVSRETRSSLWALIEIYRRLLEKIEARGYDVMKERIRLSTFAKLRILAEALMRRYF